VTGKAIEKIKTDPERVLGEEVLLRPSEDWFYCFIKLLGFCQPRLPDWCFVPLLMYAKTP